MMDPLIIYFVGGSIIALLMFLIRSKMVNYLLFVPFLGLQVYVTYHVANNQNVLEDVYFKTDAIGFIFLAVLTILSITTVIHSIIYNEKRHDNSREIAIHNAALVLFILTMTGVLISSHVGLLWAFLEATTLCVSVLIYHERDAAALEAAWKYVFVCSVGIALAFIGILFLGIASQDARVLDLSMDSLQANAVAMDPVWLKLCFLFILTGFSVKMGVTPLFAVGIDAKDAAPSPTAALMSGGMLNVGFVAILRFYQIFAGTSIHGWMNSVLLIVGVVSILFATVYLLKITNYKRMFAYSTLEHAGIVLVALAAGGVGYFAAILHLVLHALIKASMFYQIGQVKRTYQEKSLDKIGGYFKLNPWGGTVLLLGFFCVTAMPPSGLFVSEFLIFKALLDGNHVFVTIVMLILLSFTVFALGRSFLRLLFLTPHGGIVQHERVSPLESATQWVLLLTVIYLGVFPPAQFTNFIQLAVQSLPNQINYTSILP